MQILFVATVLILLVNEAVALPSPGNQPIRRSKSSEHVDVAYPEAPPLPSTPAPKISSPTLIRTSNRDIQVETSIHEIPESDSTFQRKVSKSATVEDLGSQVTSPPLSMQKKVTPDMISFPKLDSTSNNDAKLALSSRPISRVKSDSNLQAYAARFAGEGPVQDIFAPPLPISARQKINPGLVSPPMLDTKSQPVTYSSQEPDRREVIKLLAIPDESIKAEPSSASPIPLDLYRGSDIPLNEYRNTRHDGHNIGRETEAVTEYGYDSDDEEEDVILPDERYTLVQTTFQSLWQVVATVLLRKNVWVLINSYILAKQFFSAVLIIVQGDLTIFQIAASRGDTFIQDIVAFVNNYFVTLPQELADFANLAIYLTIKTAILSLVAVYRVLFNFAIELLDCTSSFTVQYVNDALNGSISASNGIINAANDVINKVNGLQLSVNFPTLTFIAPSIQIQESDFKKYLSTSYIDGIIDQFGETYLQKLIQLDTNGAIPPIEFPYSLSAFVSQNLDINAINEKPEYLIQTISTVFQATLIVLIVWCLLAPALRPWFTRPGMPSFVRKNASLFLPEIRVLERVMPVERKWFKLFVQPFINFKDLVFRDLAVRGFVIAMVIAAVMQLLLLGVNLASGPLQDKAKSWDAQIDATVNDLTGPVTNTLSQVIGNIETLVETNPLTTFLEQQVSRNPDTKNAYDFFKSFSLTAQCNPFDIFVNATSFLFVLSLGDVLMKPVTLTEDILKNIQSNIRSQHTQAVEDALSIVLSDLKSVLSSTLPWNTILGTGGVYLISKVVFALVIPFVPPVCLKYLNIHPLPPRNARRAVEA